MSLNHHRPEAHPRAGGKRSGENNGRAKLGEEDVRLLRRLVESGACTIREAAKKFDITVRQGQRIVKRTRWGHV